VDGLPDRLKPDQLGLIEGASDDPARYPLALSHLFGTARMSGRPEDGVVGHDFQVHGTENLYVVDSSVFPTNLGVNPQVTIMALARLAAQRMLS
jgi:choline dehydrogenase-like flavoprotein